jgi:ATP-dependent DNA helicase RecG
MTTSRLTAVAAGQARSASRSPLDIPAQYVKGVGPARAAQLVRLELRTVEDLLYHAPHRYEDRSHLATITSLVPGMKQTTQGVVIALSEKRYGAHQFVAAISDDTGVLQAIWFGQRYLRRVIHRGTRVIVHGKVERAGPLQMIVDEHEILTGDEDDTLHTGRIVPMHPATEGLSPRVLRFIIARALDQYLSVLPEVLPDQIRRQYDLVPLQDAVRGLHFPTSMEEAAAAHRRLAFDELLVLQLGVLMRRQALQTVEKGIRYARNDGLLPRFLATLPYALTAAQRRVLDEVAVDLYSPRPMNRLLQGDVGSGKTVVAAAALGLCVGGGCQGALMAPTEILAEQHYLTFRHLLAPLGMRVALVVGGTKRKERDRIRAALGAGEVDLAVGTHALLEEGVEFARLGLVVVDEQHKFGVMQRAILRRKGFHPDVLVMTATPIPRTLTMTLYGDLDVSVLDELPPGRGAIKTYVRGPEKGPEVYRWMRQQVDAGRQAYVVCPLIEESDKLQAEAAVHLADRLRREVFDGVALGLLHGRMRPEDKDTVMEQFRQGTLRVLVATPVIEVGIDVPQATIMVVEDADRFGLAQLHQLRGRVGRGAETSYCVLLSSAMTDAARTRLETMARTRDGFVIAQKDLELRGPGELLGTRQHGLPDLRIADLMLDVPILEVARQEALRLLHDDPDLSRPDDRELRQQVRRRFVERSGVVAVG